MGNTMLKRLLSLFRNLFRKHAVEHALDDELRSSVEVLAQEKMKQGLSESVAHREALIELGGIEQVKEEVRAVRAGRLLEDLARDVRFGFRTLAKSPGFTTVAVLTLALGIGASTAIFSVVDAVLLSPLPYPNPQRIVRVWEQTASGHRIKLADPNFDDFRTHNRTLSALAEYAALPLAVAGGSEPVRANVAIVSKGFFRVLGVQPFLGRTFAPEEQRLDGARAAIVSYAYWKQYLGSKKLSRLHLMMNGGVYPVVGVMPRGFEFPQGAGLWIAREGALPQSTSRTNHSWNCIGRIRNGDTLAQARADLDMIARRIRTDYGKQVNLVNAAVVPLANAMVGNVRTAVLTLFGAVMLLFLVACANVAGLLLARSLARRKELAVCTALGAGRGRLVRQLLAESLLMASAGGGLGVLTAMGLTRLLPSVLPTNLPQAHGIAINPTVLFFTLASILMVAAGLGVFAAWSAGQVNLADALGASSRSFSGRGQGLRSALVVGEIAATLVMLVAAGLLGRSFLDLISVSPGFNGQSLMVAKVSRPPSQTTFAPESRQEIADRVHFFNDAVTRLRMIPGVRYAGVTGGLPIADPDGFPEGTFLILNGLPAPGNWHDWDRLALDAKQTGEADYCVAGAGFFRTLGIPLIRGRLFNAQDGLSAPNVAVISEALARDRWPHEEPIGQVIDFGNSLKPLTIIGVVGNIRAEGLDQPPSPIIYVDYRQRGFGLNTSPAVVLRTSLPPGEIVPLARRTFHDLNPSIPVQFSTFGEAMGGWMAERLFILLLAGAFGGAALALAGVGTYGLVAQWVARRTHEIGIRMALGAQRTDVLTMVVGQGLRLALIGLVIGVAGALALTRFLSSLLFGVKPTDPVTFIAASLLLTAAALLACYVPARRAARMDPMVALRYE